MSFLNILQAAVAVEQPVIARKASGPRKEWNPTTADIRIWGDGSVYPSQELIEKYSLNFTDRILDEATGKWKNEAGGFGFDVFDTKNYAAIQNARFVAIAVAPRSEGRIDLFGSCSYHSPKDAAEGTLPEGAYVGQPVVSVFDQGSNTFGKGLLVMLNEVYGVTLNEDGYIDLKITGVPDQNGVEQPFRNPNNSPIYMIPKVVSKGEKAGEPTYVRRENSEIWALLPVADSKMGALPVKEKKGKAEDDTTVPSAPAQEAAMSASAIN